MAGHVQFYRRQLPPSCIDFVSDEGRQIFKQAINEGHMVSFFKISAQYRTQAEINYCGLTSLVVALNVLEIDPGRVWKGPWRWYTEEMLDCCVPLDKIKKRGLSMEQFICLARCNNLATQKFRKFADIDELRNLIKEKVKVDNQVIILSYDRVILGQSGSGHFSPLAGYNEDRDLILIMDTARFKYPPHWIPLQLLYDAMNTMDNESGLPRGLVVLSKTNEYVGTLLFRPSGAFQVNGVKGSMPPAINDFSDSWNTWLSEMEDQEPTEPRIAEFAGNFVDGVINHLKDVAMFCLTLLSNTPASLDKSLQCTLDCKSVASDEKDKISLIYKKLINEIQDTKTYNILKQAVSSHTDNDKLHLFRLVDCSDVAHSSKEEDTSDESGGSADENPKGVENKGKCDRGANNRNVVLNLDIQTEHILTILFFAWPIDRGEMEVGTRRSCLNDWMKEELENVGRYTLQQEIVSLRFKFVEVMNYHMKEGTVPFVAHKRYV